MYEPEMQFKSSVMHSGRNDHDPDQIDNAQYASTKFYFQQRRGRLDLRTLSQIDLDKIVRDVDIDVLQIHLENITFSNLKEEDLRFLTDPQVIKLFRTSQLMIEYLLYAQEQLASNLQQMANRYGSKKRSLAKKRIELAELQESTKHLRQEVKTKKNSVAALEHLLKTCNRPRSKRRSRRDHSEEAGEEKQSVQPIRQSVIQFFVSGPDGLCVEFNERVTCSIFQLCREVRKAFVTKHDKRSKHDDNEVRLVYHGRILLNEGSIESNNIRPGDTIVAIIDTDKSDDSFGSDSRQKVAAPSSSSVAPDVVDLLARQQDAMKNVAQEMRLGWETALQAVTQQQQSDSKSSQMTEQDILGKMDIRWSKLEESMRDQLNSQLDEYKELLTAGTQRDRDRDRDPASRSKGFRSGLQVGDLESDTEDLLVSRDEFAGRLRDSTDRIKALDGELGSMKSTLSKQNAEMELLRQQVLSNKAVHNTYIDYGKSSAQPPSPHAARTASSFIPVPASIPDSLPVVVAVAAIEARVAQVSAPEVTVRPAAVPAPALASSPSPVEKKGKVIFAELDAAKAPPKAAAAAAPAPVPVPVKMPPLVIEPVVPDDGCLDITFPSAFNKDLGLGDGSSGPGSARGTDLAVVRVLRDITADELIFELRHHIATEGSVPLNRVSLVLNGAVVTMGLDVENEAIPLTAARAASLTLTGALTARISRGKPMNNAQLDVLVSHWEGQQMLGLVPVPHSLRQGGDFESNLSPAPIRRSSSSSAAATSSARGSGIASGDKKRRSWDDGVALKDRAQKEGKGAPPVIEDPWGTSHEMNLRKSLTAQLNDLSDREGLTDDELQSKVKALRRSTEQLPESLSNHLMDYKGHVAGAMAAAAADSGSEDFYTENDRLGRPRASTVTLTLSEGAQAARRSQRASQSSPLRDSVESSGLLRLSLPNGGLGRRSIESFDDDGDGDYSYGHHSGSFRQVDDDSAPMMASLSIPNKHSMPKPSQRPNLDASLTSAVDVRASQSMRSPDGSGSSGAEDGKKSKYSQFMDSVTASKTAKKIPFGSSDEESLDPGAKGLSIRTDLQAGEKPPGQPRSEGKGSKGSPRSNSFRNLKGLDDEYYSDGDEGDDDSRFEGVRGSRSNGTTGTLSGLGVNAGGKNRDSTDFGMTMSTLGSSGPVGPLRGFGKADAKGGLDRFDFDRTVDSEGEMLKGRDVPMSQVMQRADAYERQFAGAGAGAGAGGPLKSPPLRPGQLQGPHSASPMSRGSSFNSGLFDNLAVTDEVHEFGADRDRDRDRDHDGTNSLALSDSYSDNIYLTSPSSAPRS